MSETTLAELHEQGSAGRDATRWDEWRDAAGEMNVFRVVIRDEDAKRMPAAKLRQIVAGVQMIKAAFEREDGGGDA